MPCSKPFNKGFNVIEILIVIAISAVIFGIGFTVFKQAEPMMDLNGATRELITDLRYAQQLAVSEQIRYGIRFSTTTPEDRDEYSLIKHEQTLQEIFVKKLSSGINFQEISFTDQEVLFNPYGAVQEAGQVVLINSKNATTTIDIRPSGFIQKR